MCWNPHKKRKFGSIYGLNIVFLNKYYIKIYKISILNMLHSWCKKKKKKACLIETTIKVLPPPLIVSKYRSTTQSKNRDYTHWNKLSHQTSPNPKHVYKLTATVPPHALQISSDSLHNVEGNTCPSPAYHHLRPCPQTWISLHFLGVCIPSRLCAWVRKRKSSSRLSQRKDEEEEEGGRGGGGWKTQESAGSDRFNAPFFFTSGSLHHIVSPCFSCFSAALVYVFVLLLKRVANFPNLALILRK